MAIAAHRLEHDLIRLQGDFRSKEVYITAARIDEGLSRLTETVIEFITTDRALDPADILGTRVCAKLKTDRGKERSFPGICTAIETLGLSKGYHHFVIEVRPWTWFLTRASDSRIFQNQTTPDIVKAVCGDMGFHDVRLRLSGDYKPREYCVQYGETNFAFISRLMEEEGIYYYFDAPGSMETLVLADGLGSHDPVPETPSLTYKPRPDTARRMAEQLFEWTEKKRVVSGKVSLVDFDMNKPEAVQTGKSEIQKGKHGHKSYERYEMSGRFLTTAIGDGAARVMMEAEAHAADRWVAAGNARTLQAGTTLTVKDLPRGKASDDFLILSATHYLQVDAASNDLKDVEGLQAAARIVFPPHSGTYLCQFEVAQKAEQFRPPCVTPWPDLHGMHTAIVTGPKGDEIHTDELGRIKVQFHWDRQGKKDEKTTCWVRTLMPWSGKGWGSFAVPRIGQEVAIQFERGNPDRPLCVGMLYNGTHPWPVEMPGNMTQSGLRTNSTPKGGTGGHEMIFEDKKDAEFIRMVSEKDYMQTIANDATVVIGVDGHDKFKNGDLTQTVHRHKTETLTTGDHTFTVKDGNQTVSIKKDHTATVEGKSTTTVTGDTALTVKSGNLTEKVTQGKRTTEIFDDDTTTVKLGNVKIDAKLGKIEMSAMESITLKVGGNSVKIDQTGITVKGMTVKVEGSLLTEVKGLITKVEASAMLTAKGAITMIN